MEVSGSSGSSGSSSSSSSRSSSSSSSKVIVVAVITKTFSIIGYINLQHQVAEKAAVASLMLHVTFGSACPSCLSRSRFQAAARKNL